ncbi:hypothetical protein [Microbacterium sp. A1-JK]|uniref:hypothetical protein n=1 Tax=Microbacterium sp. A1-JK TaxID=3177516 RepID=UPI00388532DC
MSYRTADEAADHGARRITLRVAAPFDEMRARIEAEVPELDRDDLDAVTGGRTPWDDFVRGLSWEAPNGFVRLSSDDLGGVLSVAGRDAAAVGYLLMDWAAAARIHRIEPTALLYLPVRMLLVARGDEVALTLEQPGPHLASFGLNKLTQAGVELDRRLGDLLEALDIARPAALRR